MPSPKKSLPRARTPSLGPVANLEHHLPKDWWRTLFNATYLKTDGDVVENAANTTTEVDLLAAAAKLRPDDAILDLCCGQGRHTLELARRGFRRVTGLDQSRYLIGLARRRARAACLPVQFRVADARTPGCAPHSFDCVAILGNSFGYFDRQADDLVVLQAVRDVLRPGGALALDVSDGDWIRRHHEPRSWEWIDKRLFVCRERSLSSDQSRLICREVVVDARKGVMVDQFYAERLYSRRELQSLLREAGFVRMRDHGGIKAGSDRNLDLGMMEHRFFVTAHAPMAAGARRTGAMSKTASARSGRA